MNNKYFYFFIGTTAEFIKLAPIIKDLKKRNENFRIVTSGQNEIKFNEFTEYLGTLKVYHAFAEKDHQSSIFLFLFWTVRTFFNGLIYFFKETKNIDRKNTYFIIHGDTISALIGTVIFKILRLRIVHVEAGLRSFNFFEPFPEEICRFIINYLSDINFPQNEWSLNNLKNVSSVKVNTYQNPLIEIFWWAINKKKGLEYVKKFDRYYILIIHRQEHVYFNKEWTHKIMKMVIENANKNLNCLFIMHSLTSRFLESETLDLDKNLSKRVLFIPKLPYAEFMTLLKNSEFIATDGCTNQEEVYYLGLPCLALRNTTERVEGLNENVIICKGDEGVIKNFLKNYKTFRKKPVKPSKSPSKIIVEYLLKSS